MTKQSPYTRAELKEYLTADLELREQKKSLRLFLRRYLFEAGFKYIYWLRKTRYHYLNNHRIRFLWSWFWLKHYGYKYSFDISYHAQIGKGLRISHYGYIVVPSSATVGDYCNLKPGVVIGLKHTGGKYRGHTIGNEVDFGVGSKVIGDGIVIGDNVSIGANAVVTKSVLDNAVVVGIPAKVIKIKEQHIRSISPPADSTMLETQDSRLALYQSENASKSCRHEEKCYINY